MTSHRKPVADNLRARSRIGKYRIERKVGSGGFGNVYVAMDTIEGVRVALKVPHEHLVDESMLEQFRHEVRLVAKLDHPHILPLRNADIIDGRFVFATLLGRETLDNRLGRRLATEKAFSFTRQMIAAVAYAHRAGIVHCDIKPENFILFDGDVLRLADFGIAKVSRLTIEGAGTGTIGHMAPEQAMGKPSFRSDVFSTGLIVYRMLAGVWPEYPFDWPPPSFAKLRTKRVHRDLIAVIKKSIAAKPRARYADGQKLEQAFAEVLPAAIRHVRQPSRRGGA